MERTHRTQAYTAIHGILLLRIGNAREAVVLKIKMDHLVNGNICLVEFHWIMGNEQVLFNGRATPSREVSWFRWNDEEGWTEPDI